ncbi:MAG TPA: hypothetical protein VFB77_14770 [Acidimicrobiales bacterium]|nr:hypothetical protein [Acidimicrobiales bacterium]
MTKQLTLIDTPKDWRLDDRTRELGFEGVAKARAALRDGLRHRPPATAPPGRPGRRRGGTSPGTDRRAA